MQNPVMMLSVHGTTHQYSGIGYPWILSRINILGFRLMRIVCGILLNTSIRMEDAKSSGGTSGNAINGVSPNNPNAEKYNNAAKTEFGE